jgi:hypothetical protein
MIRYSLRALTWASLPALLLATAPAQAVPLPSNLGDWTCTGNCGNSAADGDIVLSPTGNARYGFVTTADSSESGVSPVSLDPNSRGGGSETNGSRYLSPVFAAAANATLDMWFNYVSTDGKGYDDYAWARLIDANTGGTVAWLFTAESTNSGPKNIVPGKVVDNKDFDPDAVIVDFKNWDYNSKTTDDPIDWTPLGFSNGSCWKDNADGCGYTGWMNSRQSIASAGSFRVEVGVVNWGDFAYDSGLAFDFVGLTAPAGTPPAAAVPEPGTMPMALAGALALGLLARRRARA